MMDTDLDGQSNSVIATTPGIPTPPTREGRGSVAFGVAAAFGLAVLLLYVSASGVVYGAVGTAGLAAFVGLGIYLAEAVGLSSRSPWARAAMDPLLWIMLVAGLVSLVLALAAAQLHFPIGTALAIWALRARPDPTLGQVPPLAGLAAAVVIAALLSAVLPFLMSL